MKYINKPTVLVTSSVILVTSLFIVEEIGFCRNVLNFDTGCVIPATDSFEIVFLSFVILIFPLSLLTLPLKPSVFEAWKKFAVWAVPVIMILVALIEAVGTGGGLPGQFHPGLIFYPLFGIVYFTISFIVIGVSWWKSRKIVE